MSEKDDTPKFPQALGVLLHDTNLTSRPVTDEEKEIVRELALLHEPGEGESERALELSDRFWAIMGLPPIDPTVH